MNIPQRLMPLSPSDRVAGEMIIGVYPVSETETFAAVQQPANDSVLRGTRLCVPMPTGNQISDPDLALAIASELRHLLGGCFESNLAPLVHLYDSLIPKQLRQSRAEAIDSEESGGAFYYIDFSIPGWQVQCAGSPETFHAIFIARLLTEPEALGDGGHPRIFPAGEVEPVLLQATPNIAQQSFEDRTAQHARNVFDTYLWSDRGIVVKAGVRIRLTEAGAAFPGPRAYFYGIRVNIDRRHTTVQQTT